MAEEAYYFFDAVRLCDVIVCKEAIIRKYLDGGKFEVRYKPGDLNPISAKLLLERGEFNKRVKSGLIQIVDFIGEEDWGELRDAKVEIDAPRVIEKAKEIYEEVMSFLFKYEEKDDNSAFSDEDDDKEED